MKKARTPLTPSHAGLIRRASTMIASALKRRSKRELARRLKISFGVLTKLERGQHARLTSCERVIAGLKKLAARAR